MRQGTAGGRLGTAAPARPMTASNKAAGYSGGRPGTAVAGGPAVAGSKGPAPPLRKKPEDGPDVAIKEHEAKCHELLEASSRAQVDKDWVRAVETAREACKRERQLARVRENAGMGDSENLELAFANREAYDASVPPKQTKKQTNYVRLRSSTPARSNSLMRRWQCCAERRSV